MHPKKAYRGKARGFGGTSKKSFSKTKDRCLSCKIRQISCLVLWSHLPCLSVYVSLSLVALVLRCQLVSEKLAGVLSEHVMVLVENAAGPNVHQVLSLPNR